MELNKYLLVVLLTSISTSIFSSEQKVHSDVTIFEQAIHIINDTQNNHPHKQEIKKIIDLYTSKENSNLLSASEAAQQLAHYIKNNRTILATLEDDRTKMTVFGNALSSIQQFHATEQKTPALPIVKQLVKQFEKTMDDYFAGESTPTTIEKITTTSNQLNALNKAHQQTQSHKTQPRSARKNIVKKDEVKTQQKTVKSLVDSYQATITNEIKQTEQLNKELDTKIEEFKTNTPAQTITTPPTMWPTNFESLPTISQMVIANTEYRELDRRLSAHSDGSSGDRS